MFVYQSIVRIYNVYVVHVKWIACISSYEFMYIPYILISYNKLDSFIGQIFASVISTNMYKKSKDNK